MKFLKTLVVLALIGSAVYVYAQQAQVSTEDATNRNIREARLVGTVSFGGEIPFGQTFFEYGRTEVYGRTTPVRSVTQAGEFSEKVTGLNPDSGYNFRAVMVAADGELIYGANKDFVTKRIESDTPVPNGSSDTDTGDTTNDVPDPSLEPDTDGDGIPDSVECPGQAAGALCPDTDGDGKPDYKDEDSDGDGILDTNEEEGQRTESNRPVEGTTFTDTSGNSCLGSTARPVYDISNQQATSGGVTATRGSVIGYRCPTDEDIENPLGGAGSTGTGVNVGDLSDRGTIIPNGTGVPTGDRPTSNFSDQESGGIVKCGQREGEYSRECRFNDVIATMQTVIELLLYFSILIFVALMVYAGFRYMTSAGNMEQTKSARKMMTNGLIGIAIIAFAWLAINSTLEVLVKDDSGAQNFLQ